MENQTRFDLTIAVENWRQELAAQPAITDDNRRELEAHLDDSLVELKRRGLNEEESFWLACRRVGSSQKLAQEFTKNDPAQFWRARALWLAVALLAIRFFLTLGNCTWQVFSTLATHFVLNHPNFQLVPDWVVFYLPFLRSDFFYLISVLHNPYLPIWLGYLFLGGTFLIFIRGRLPRVESWGYHIFETRRRYLWMACPFFLLYSALVLNLALLTERPDGILKYQVLQNSLFGLVGLAAHLSVIAFLIPSKSAKPLKPVS